jgi:pyrroloquinoline quinone (PQQ) biosynthesis protein C
VAQFKAWLLWMYNLERVAPHVLVKYLSGIKYYLAEAGKSMAILPGELKSAPTRFIDIYGR